MIFYLRHLLALTGASLAALFIAFPLTGRLLPYLTPEKMGSSAGALLFLAFVVNMVVLIFTFLAGGIAWRLFSKLLKIELPGKFHQQSLGVAAVVLPTFFIVAMLFRSQTTGAICVGVLAAVAGLGVAFRQAHRADEQAPKAHTSDNALAQ